MSQNRRVGILGGTFDPIHNGHLKLAECALDAARLAEVWIMPNRVPPHKENITGTRHTMERVDMIRLAIEDRPELRFFGIELEMDGPSYTYRTIEELNRQYAGTDFFFIIGADSLFEFEKWYKPERIASGCTLLVAKRKDQRLPDFEQQIDMLKSRFGAVIVTIPMDTIDISSQMIRYKRVEGESISQYVPPKVEKYISENHMYELK